MKKYALLLFFFISSWLVLYAQRSEVNFPITIRGTIYSAQGNEALSFANIHNRSNQVGAISNFNGYFEIEITSYDDSIQVSYIGYKPIIIPLAEGKTSYQLHLNQSAQMLRTVEIKPKNNDHLYDLIVACRKKQNDYNHRSKAYYQLKSYIDKEQIELIESFYNARIKGYNLEKLSLKTGRVGLRKTLNEQIFMSLESSRAISLHNLFEMKPWFPIQPLNEVRRKLKKNFYINLKAKYQEESGDTIVHLELKPKKNARNYFITNLWINKNDEHLLKVKFEGTQLRKHPFLPFHAMDTLKNMNIQIVKTFKELGNHMVLDHIDFNYQFDYAGHVTFRSNDIRQMRGYKNFHVNTKAVIKFYAAESQFKLPLFEYPTVASLNDYAKLNAFPFNDFFWKNHKELVMKDKIDSNSVFLHDSRTFNNQRIFSRSKQEGYGFFAKPYINWKGNRIIFKPYAEDQSLSQIDPYQLKAKIFLDYNHYNDSIDILSKTVFDPYETYYKAELDTTGHCFINIYFDLIEMERRKMVKKIKESDRSYSAIKKVYKQSLESIKKLEEDYFAEVMQGKNLESLQYYNDLVYKELNIDNFKLFQISLE